jgi:hypothetical protein
MHKFKLILAAWQDYTPKNSKIIGKIEKNKKK